MKSANASLCVFSSYQPNYLERNISLELIGHQERKNPKRGEKSKSRTERKKYFQNTPGDYESVWE
jgi:hypothetical protein